MSEASKISIVINTLNEEENLARCVKSVSKFADEIVVVDMKSTDATRTIARRAGAKVFEHKRMGYVEPARNYAISKAVGDWILVLDADEEIPVELRKKLKQIAQDPDADYYRIPRKNIIFGKWIRHSRWWPDHNIRFFRKGFVEWSEIIHSVPTTMGRGLDLPADEKNAMVHHHYDTVEQYINRLNRYTSMQAKSLHKERYFFKWRDLVRRPSAEFLSRYFQGQGYKDGLHGLALAALQAFSELVLYLKVWQLGKFKKQSVSVNDVIKEFKVTQKDANYWHADTLLNEVGGVKNKIKRKFKLF